MDVETAILPLIEKLRELQKETVHPRLRPQVEDSIEKLTQVQKSLEDQESNSLSLELLQAVYRAEDALDTFRKEIRKDFLQQKLSVFIQISFSNKMKKLVGDVQVKNQKMLKDAPSKTKRSTAAAGDADSDHKKTWMLDLKDEVKELAELILTDYSSPFKIPVVDVAGSVKKTELWKMYGCEDIKNRFKYRAWFDVPEELEKGELVTKILNQVSEHEVGNIESWQQELREFLIDKRYLVVLIDVRTPDIWEILKFIFPNSSKGSCVILSFAEADAARHRNVKFFGRHLSLNPENKRVLSDISKDDVGSSGNDDSILEKVSDAEILKEETEIVGLKDHILNLAKVTLNGGRKYFVISVVGVAGSGKTALVKTIYNSSYTRRNFNCRAWVNVYVSHDFDMRNVLSNILEQITGVKVEKELPQNELESKLTSCLHKKRYLIVLDDVHLPGAWNELKLIFSPKSASIGSRVILITREARVARSFSPSILHELRLLKEDENRQLFLNKVGREDISPELSANIWELCRGLPLAISVLGGLLSTLPDSEWSDVIKQIISERKKKQADSDAIFPDELLSLHDTSSVWGLGYKFLSPHLKACLHYFCLFPKSYEIRVRRLFQLWLAERFMIGGNIAPEDRVKKDFELLERRNMIEVVKRRSDGMAKSCRVPSSLYDTFFPDAKKIGFFHIHHNSRLDSTSNSPDSGVRRLAQHLDSKNNTPSDNKHFKYLHSYISFDYREGDKPAGEVADFLMTIIDKSKRGYGLLRVLDLEGVYKPVLPETIRKLRLLRYLGLRWSFLDSIPESVGDLPCLETLDLKHTNITSLPMSILKIKTLRHLYMNDIHFQISIQKPFARSSLTNLQTLWGLLIGNKSPAVNWLKGLSNLRKLGLTCHTVSLTVIINWIQGLTSSLEALRLRSINDFGEPSDLDFGSLEKHKKLTELYLLGRLPRALNRSKLPPNLKIFTLSLSYLSEDPMPMLEKLEHLKILRLFAHSYIGEQMTCHRGGFPQLLVLQLWELKELKDWNVEDGAMSALTELEIRNCQKLKKPVGLQKLTTLTKLTLTNMKKDFEAQVGGSMAQTIDIVIYPPRDTNTHEGEVSGVKSNSA